MLGHRSLANLFSTHLSCEGGRSISPSMFLLYSVGENHGRGQLFVSGVDTDVNISFSHQILFWLFSYDAYVALTLVDISMVVPRYHILQTFDFIDDRKRKVLKPKKYLAKYRVCSMVCLVVSVSNLFLFYQILIIGLFF